MRTVHWLYWNSHTWSSGNLIVMLKWNHHIMSHLSIFRNFWEPFFKHKMWYLMVSKKKNLLFVWGWDRIFCPSWSLFVITRQLPCDANRWSLGLIFLSHPHTHDRFLYYNLMYYLDYWWLFQEKKIARVHNEFQRCVFKTSKLWATETTGHCWGVHEILHTDTEIHGLFYGE